METTARPVGQILETPLWEKPEQITAPSTVEKPSEAIQKRKRDWLAKWLKLSAGHHPKLRALEDAVYGYLCDMAKNPLRGYPLILCGKNGCGKTHSARAIERWVFAFSTYVQLPIIDGKIPSFDFNFCYWPKLLDQFKDGEWRRVDGLVEAAVLILDDLGAGHDPSLVGVDKLNRILSEREEKWTVVTTNISPPDWENVFDRRIASRLFRNSTIVDLDGVPDYASVS